MDTAQKPTQDQLLKAVADVLDEALAIYEDAVEPNANDVKKGGAVSSKMDEGIDAKMDASAGMHVSAKPVSTPGIGDGSTTGIMAKEEDGKKDKDKKDKDDMDKSDDELMALYTSMITKMEARGLMQKAEQLRNSMKKSENASVGFVGDLLKAEADELRKSMDDRFESLAKTVKDVAETVKKIATSPQARKGVTGYTPLKKNEGPQPLRKSDVMGKLLDLKKNGDPRVDTTFITRIEQGRLMKGDEDRLKALGIGE